MRILIVGVLDILTSTNVQIEQAFKRLGHDVVGFNYRTIAWQVGHTEMEHQLIEKVKELRPELVFLCKTNKMNPDYVSRIGDFSKTWYWWMDWLKNCVDDDCTQYARRANWCSATSTEVLNVFTEVNVHSYKIYEGFNPDIFRLIGMPKKYDVIFVGQSNHKRSMIIEVLRSSGINVTTFGSGFDNPSIYLEELNKLHNESKIVLNICWSDIFSNRVMDVAGSGAFVLSECCTDLKADFPSFVCFKDDSECISLVEYYLNHSEEREALARLNYDVVQGYTWKRQMEKVLEIVER